MFFELWAIATVFAIPNVLVFCFLNEDLFLNCTTYPRYCADFLIPRTFSCKFRPYGSGGGKDSINTWCTNNLIEYQELILMIAIIYFSIGYALAMIRLFHLFSMLCQCSRRYVKVESNLLNILFIFIPQKVNT